MQIKKIFAALLALAMVFSLAGCNKKDDNPSQSSSGAETQDEFVIYHSSKELDSMLSAAARAYSKATGKQISVKFSEGGIASLLENEKPALFVADTKSDLSTLFEKGAFSEIASGLFGGAALPEGLWLNQNGTGSYGVPLMLEGYGYIFDRDMLSALFGEEAAEALARDLRLCSYTDFNGFAAAVETYIKAPSDATVTVNGSEYTFEKEKTGRAQMLTGVFALTPESTRAYEYLMDYALAAKFGKKAELYSAAENDVNGMKDIFSAAAQALDDMTGKISGVGGSIGRGEDFTGGDYTYSAAIDAFTGGFALFYPGSTSDAADFKKSSVTFGENLDIIPMKLPLSDSDITAADMTAEKLNRSLAIGSRYYLAINPNADAAKVSAARDFIKWLYTDNAGMAAFSESFGGFGFNYSGEGGEAAEENSAENRMGRSSVGSSAAESKPVSTDDNSVSTGDSSVSTDDNSVSTGGNSVSTGDGSSSTESGAAAGGYAVSGSLMSALARYYADGDWFPAMAYAVPGGWSSDVFGKSLTDYWNKPTWSDEDRESLVSGWITGWRDFLNK